MAIHQHQACESWHDRHETDTSFNFNFPPYQHSNINTGTYNLQSLRSTSTSYHQSIMHLINCILNDKRPRVPPLEARVRALRKQIRDVQADGFGNAASFLFNRRDLAGGNYKHDKALKAKQKVVYWQIDRTFEHIWGRAENRMTELYSKLDKARFDVQLVKARIRELEAEAIREGVQTTTSLVPVMALHCNKSMNKKPTGFFDLPPELRNEIYKLSECLELSVHDDTCWESAPLDCQCAIRVGNKMTMYVNHSQTGRSCYPRRVKLTSHSVLYNSPSTTHHWNLDATSTKGNAQIAFNHQPSLTRVSKRVRAETLPMYYGNLHIKYSLHPNDETTSNVFQWLRRIGKRNAALLNHFEVTIGCYWPEGVKQEDVEYLKTAKARCEGMLRELGVVVERCTFIVERHP